jgi:hypothetical protein
MGDLEYRAGVRRTVSTTAEQIRDTLREIKQVRAGMLSASGWSWRTAGYPYDPDENDHHRLCRLLARLDALLMDVNP